jgi:hypothetical protein
VLREGRLAVVLDVAGTVDAHVQPVVGADVGVAGPADGHLRDAGGEVAELGVAGAVHVHIEAAGGTLQGDVGRPVRADLEGVGFGFGDGDPVIEASTF